MSSRWIRWCWLVLSAGSSLIGCSAIGEPSPTSDPTQGPPDADPDPVPELAHRGCRELAESAGSEAEREAAFELLSGAHWEGVDCGQGINGIPFRCDRLSLSSDGSYTWTAWSDYPEREDGGTWNFFTRTATAGTLFFSNGTSVLFEYDTGTGELMTSRVTLVGTGASEVVGTAAALPPVRPPGLYRGLLSSCWHKTNEFDDPWVPDELALDGVGGYLASYRQGGCEHRGVFAVDEGKLVQRVEPNDCASGETGLFPHLRPEVIDGLLVFQEGPYRPAADLTNGQVFFVDSSRPGTGMPGTGNGTPSYESVRVVGRFEGPLTEGAATSLHIELENEDEGVVRLHTLTLELTEVMLEGGATTPSGELDYHELADLNGRKLEPGESLSFDAEFVPAVAGPLVSADFALEFTRYNGQSRSNQARFVLPIEPGIAVPVTPRPEPEPPPVTGSPPSFSRCGTLESRYRIDALAFSPDGAVLATGTGEGDGSVVVWDVATLTQKFTIPGNPPPQSGVNGLVLGHDFLARAVRGAVQAFALVDGDWAPTFTLGTLEGSWYGELALSPDGGVLATGIRSGIPLHARESGERVGYLQTTDGASTAIPAYAPDGRLASFGDPHLVKVWDPRAATLLFELDDHTDRVTCGGFGEGSLLVTGSYDHTLVLWNTDDGSVLRRIDTGGTVFRCTLMSDGTIVAVAGQRLLLFRSDDGGGPLVLDEGHAYRFAVAPDASRIATNAGVFCRD